MSTLISIVVSVIVFLFTIITLSMEITKQKNLYKAEKKARDYYEGQLYDLQKKYKKLNEEYKASVTSNNNSMLDFMQNGNASSN